MDWDLSSLLMPLPNEEEENKSGENKKRTFEEIQKEEFHTSSKLIRLIHEKKSNTLKNLLNLTFSIFYLIRKFLLFFNPTKLHRLAITHDAKRWKFLGCEILQPVRLSRAKNSVADTGM